MKHVLAISLAVLVLFSCGRNGVRSFWDSRSIGYTDIHGAEDQFVQFANLAVAAPEADAFAAMDVLFDKLKQDTVGYYIYSDWMVSAFYNLLSPCRNAALFTKAVERMTTDGVVISSILEDYLRQRDWIQYNQVGQKATVPGFPVFDGRTLVLVLDLGCSSCREALETLGADPRWADARHLAVGCGYGPQPDVPGWGYVIPENATVVFDPRLTPIYFVVASDGTVEIPYTFAL